MNNKFITKIIGASLAIAMMIGGAVGINTAKEAKPAHADTAAYTLGYTKNDKNSNYATAYSVTSGGIGWTVYANISTNNGYYIGGKSANNLTRTFTSTGYIAPSIDKIVVHTATMDAGSASVTAKASTSSSFASNVKQFSSVNLAANGDFEITYDAGTDANSYFQLTFTVNPNNTGSNKKVVVTSIDFYEHIQSAETVTGVSATMREGVFYSEDTLKNTDFNLTVTWSGDKADTHPTTGFTWTVNGVANGALSEGSNDVVVTYQEVNSEIINVNAIVEPGTIQNNPLSVEDALVKGNALTAGNETAKTYFIQGTVSEIVSNQLAAAAAYATFWLQNGETTRGFEAYQIPAADGCSNFNDLKVGAEVLLKCKIFRYNASTIETGSDKALLSISYAAPVLAGVALNKTSLSLEIDEFETLTVSPNPVGAELGDVTWESSNTNVATVDDNGKVTGIGAGSATITVTASGFTATCNVTVELAAQLNLASSESATHIAAEKMTWEVANAFVMENAKGTGTDANNYYPGKPGQSYTSTRFYSGNVLTLTPDKNLVAVRAVFTATTNSYANALKNSSFTNGTSSVSENVVTVTFTDGMKPLVASIGATCGFTSVKLFYVEKTARQQVETNLSTQTQLSYRYTGNAQDGFAYSDISIRFGANITKALWDELDTNEHFISGFGVIIADGDLVTNATDMAAAMSDVVSSTVTTTFTQEVYAIDYFVPVANMASTIGEDANNYFWNLRWAIDEANMDKMYSAVAYIKVGDEYVLMNMARESVETLALDYLTSRDCNETTAEGSLQAIVDNAA